MAGEAATPIADAFRLKSAELYRQARLDNLAFETTADLAPPTRMIAQDRALDAIDFGSRIGAQGFNVFVIGPDALRMRENVRVMLEARAARMKPPADWVYVNNFVVPHKPVAISLPPGRAVIFRDKMHELIEDLKAALPAAFENSDYQNQRAAIEDAMRDQQEKAFGALREKAMARALAVVRTQMGFGFVPVRNGKVIPPEEFMGLPREEQESIQAAMRELEPELEQTLRSMPKVEKARREALRKLDRDNVQFAVEQNIVEVKELFGDIPAIISHLEAVKQDLIDNVELFAQPQTEAAVEAARTRVGGPFDRYEVNVLVADPACENCAPVIEELHPTLGNLVGRIEHLAQQGMLITNFRLIKAGALHRANGGFLLLDARSLVTEPFSWQALKRALLTKSVQIEDTARAMGLSSTISLEPDPVPLDVKVIIFADRQLYYMLNGLDPDMQRLFKVLADFDDATARSPENEAQLARMLAGVQRVEGLRPASRSAIERMVEYASRIASDREKVSLLVEPLRDLLIEANDYAMAAEAEVIGETHVERAIDQQRIRCSRIESLGRESIMRDIALIQTIGSKVGQINALSVMSLGGYGFGKPSRITCRVSPGAGRIIDIEREVELGGPFHSKGVMILSGFLSGRYALKFPIALQASIVFEQSYGGVDGDSASSTELYCLLSALGEIPLRQDLAVTGSVNQHGDVQAIGGVNEKIEGFFDVCNARGLTGTQGVLVPRANVQHLMLRKDVRDACDSGRFSIYSISRIDEGMELLSGLPGGQANSEGLYPEGTFNRIVQDRLALFARIRKEQGPGSAGNGKDTPT
jgi:lon-related putative ATP-dependent protease